MYHLAFYLVKYDAQRDRSRPPTPEEYKNFERFDGKPNFFSYKEVLKRWHEQHDNEQVPSYTLKTVVMSDDQEENKTIKENIELLEDFVKWVNENV